MTPPRPADLFDRRIKERMADLEAPYQPASWDALASRLPAGNPLDETVRTAMANHAAAPAPASWETLRNKMDLEPALRPTGNELDNTVREKLSDYGAGSNTPRWESLSTRLDDDDRRRRRALLFFLSRAAVFALAVYTLWHYAAIPGSRVHPTQPQAVKAPATPAAEQPPYAPQLSNTTAPASFAATPAPDKYNKTTIAARTGHSGQAMPPIHTDAYTGQDQPVTEYATAGISTDKPAPPPADATPLPELPAPPPASQEPLMQTTGTSPTLPLPAIPVNELAQADHRVAPAVQPLPPPAPERAFRLGFFGSFDANHVMTPYDWETYQEAYAQTVPGYGGGISAGYKLGRWEVETGLVYAAKHYMPRTYAQPAKPTGPGNYLSDVELNIVGLPLNVRFDVERRNRWKAYALAGASFQLILQANYDRREVLLSPLAPGFGLDGNQRSGGLFGGGTFADSYYLTANAGVGLEYQMAPRFSFFVQPTYHHQLFPEGNGPKKDKINSLSLLTGVKVTL